MMSVPLVLHAAVGHTPGLAMLEWMVKKCLEVGQPLSEPRTQNIVHVHRKTTLHTCQCQLVKM